MRSQSPGALNAILAEPEVADFSLVDHLFQLLPGRIGIRSELLVKNILALFLERNGPMQCMRNVLAQ